MIAAILGYLLSLATAAALFYWLRSLRKDDAYRKLCNKALQKGAVCSFVIIAVSGALSVALRLTGLREVNPLLYRALHTFVVLALAEEAVKFLTSRRVLTKTAYPFSWMDVALVMTLVGVGFGVMENIAVAVGSNMMVMLIRAICIAHGSYGFLTGYFYGKGMKTGKNSYKVIGFVLTWLLHGLYDFSLSEEFIALNEKLVIVAVALVAIDIVLEVIMIVFFAKARKNELYTEPLRTAEAAPESVEI